MPDNLRGRQFQADAPIQEWVADFTDIWTAEGRLVHVVLLQAEELQQFGYHQINLQHRLNRHGLRSACIEPAAAHALIKLSEIRLTDIVLFAD